jgi:hypothetical protein
MTASNITTGMLRLPAGVQVSFPLGNSMNISQQDLVIVHLTFSSTLHGVIHLEFGAFRQEVGGGWSGSSPAEFSVTVGTP